jgi:menaquinol-cytochrome c reductase iron-sulfur subunit
MQPKHTTTTCTHTESGRRSFLGGLTALLGAVASAVVAIPCFGYFLGARKPPVSWVKLGPVKDFAQGETRMVTFDNPLRQPWDGMTAETGVYVRYQGADEPDEKQFLVLAVNCAHLGCPVSWFPQSGLFMCPCHGGVYYSNGARASGPPPRGLFHCVWRVRDEVLEVQAPHYPTLQDTLEKPA